MKRFMLGCLVFALAPLTVGFAQPPGPREEGRRPDGPPPPPPMPLIEALDKNRDRTISEDEINAAVEALRSLDRNQDGKLSEEEFAPRPPRPERDGGPRDGGPRDGGPRDGGPRDGGPRDGGPWGEGRPGDRGPAGPRGPQGPPNPERFVDHAMQFDADSDGKLNRDELMKFAQQMHEHRPGHEHGGPPEGRPRGPRMEGPPEGRGPGRPEREREAGAPERGPEERRPPVE